MTSDIKTTVAIVGGGFTGVATALMLTERGIDCVVLEQNEIGWGASGRNGGQVIHGFGGAELSEIPEMGKMFGSENLSVVFDMAVESVCTLRDFVHRHNIACDLKWGYVEAAMNKRQYRDIQEGLEVLTRHGYPHHTYTVDRADMSKVVGSPRYAGATVDMGAGHVQPLDLVRGEARVAATLGCQILEHVCVQDIEESETSVILRTDCGTVTADTVVLGGNAYLGTLGPDIARKIMPVGSYIIATEPLTDDEVQQTLPQDMAVCDLRNVLDYYRLSDDKRLLYGGRANYSGTHPKDIAPGMRARMRQTFPHLADKKIDYAWGGNIGITVNRMPHIGRHGDRVFFAQGFSGHGVAPTHLMAKLMAEAIAGQTERFDVFAKIKMPDFPGGVLRTQVLTLGMLYYRFRDILGF